jgi:hypothetical protein
MDCVLSDLAFPPTTEEQRNFRRTHSNQKRVSVQSCFVRKAWSFVKDLATRERNGSASVVSKRFSCSWSEGQH